MDGNNGIDFTACKREKAPIDLQLHQVLITENFDADGMGMEAL